MELNDLVETVRKFYSNAGVRFYEVKDIRKFIVWGKPFSEQINLGIGSTEFEAWERAAKFIKDSQ